MSSRIFKSVIMQMRDATDRCLGVVDDAGMVVACNELSMIGSHLDAFRTLQGDYAERVFVHGGYSFKPIGNANARPDYAVFVDGDDDTARCVCVLAAVAFSEAKTNYEEKHNRTTFVKNIISDNILPGDVYVRAKELHFEDELPRAVLLIRLSDKADMAVAEELTALYPDRQRDFVLTINETDIVLIKEMQNGAEGKEAIEVATEVQKALDKKLGLHPIIGIGTTAYHLRELAERFKEAQVAIEVGKVFDEEKTIIHYENLGIGRLIYQLPNKLCEMFLREVFKKNPIESLDQETLYTINKFFENNLNVSETSRKLFVHRNTLVYRLEKIKKLTGLDLREFDHAIVFKVALMVKKYLNAQSEKY